MRSAPVRAPRYARLVVSRLLFAVTVVWLPALAGCKDPDVRCAKVTGRLPGTVVFAQCTDSRERKLECPRVAGEGDAEVMCARTRGGKMGASFTLFSDSLKDAAQDSLKATRVGNRRCGWELSERP